MRAAYLAAGAVVGAAMALRSSFATGSAAVALAERRGLWQGHAKASDPWIWIHAASVGEADIAIALVRVLRPVIGGVRFVVSSMTGSGKARLEAEDGIEARTFPVDSPRFLKRVVEPLPPLLFIAVETEIWPETLRVLARKSVPVAVVNARVSDASLPRYQRAASLLAPLLGGVARVAARDETAAARWIALGVPASVVEVTGNIKFDLATPRKGEADLPLFRREAVSALVLAASTHDSEEALALGAFAALRMRRSAVRLLLAPRHPGRAAAVLDLARSRGFVAAAWSEIPTSGAGHEGEWPGAVDVVVLDRLGLLRSAYAGAAAAFVGGSAVAGPGGHNLLEGIVAGCPLAAGVHLGNVADQLEVLREHDALWIVSDVESLSKFWLQAVDNPRSFDESLTAALGAVEARAGALERTVALLLALLPARDPR